MNILSIVAPKFDIIVPIPGNIEVNIHEKNSNIRYIGKNKI